MGHLADRVHVVLNMATSLDGRVAGPKGQPVRLSSPEDHARVHALRASSDAVLVGIGTVLSDDPRLTARTDPPPERQPLRVVLDSKARTPANARILDDQAKTLLLTGAGGLGPIEGAEIVQAGQGRVDPARAMEILEQRDVQRVLVEGGPRVARSLLGAGVVDAVHLYIAPRSLGDGPLLADAFTGQAMTLEPSAPPRPLGEGVLLSYEVPG